MPWWGWLTMVPALLSVPFVVVKAIIKFGDRIDDWFDYEEDEPL